MTPSVTSHPKFEALMSELNVQRYEAVGILELLWHITAQFYPHGDIGRATNKAIAARIGWNRDPDDLIDALVDSGWLDDSEVHRLLVHDWPGNCDPNVHLYVARRKEWFADGTTPKLYKMRRQEKRQAEKWYNEHTKPPVQIPKGKTKKGYRADGTKKRVRKPKPRCVHKDPHAEAFAAAFEEHWGVSYAPIKNPETGARDWNQADFVQLAKWRKLRPHITPERFVEVARLCWSRGEFVSNSSKTIRGLCAHWSSHETTAMMVGARPARAGDIPKPSEGGDQDYDEGMRVDL